MFNRFRDWNRSFVDWPDFDRALGLLSALQRDARPLFGDYFPMALSTGAGYVGAELVDAGDAFELHADVPGMTEGDVNISLDRNVLTLTGERKVAVPEGYTPQRRERQAVSFSRSFTLPQEVEAEKSSATVKDGVLTVRLAKRPEVKPRQITVKSS
jgi:HSP20 family protein